MEPNGQLADWTKEQYDADRTRVRSTSMKMLVGAHGEREYYLATNGLYTRKRREYWDFGDIFHQLLLEKKESFFVYKDRRDKRSAAYQDALEENNGKKAITPAQYEQLMGMRDSAMRNPMIRETLENGGFAEDTFLFTHPNTEIDAKCRVDLLAFDATIWDLKTFGKSTRDQYERQFCTLQYDFQSGFQFLARSMIPQFANLRLPIRHMVVCKEPPYWSFVFAVPPTYVIEGRKKVSIAFSRLKAAMDREAEIVAEGGDPMDAWPDREQQHQDEERPPPTWYLDKHNVEPEDYDPFA